MTPAADACTRRADKRDLRAALSRLALDFSDDLCCEVGSAAETAIVLALYDLADYVCPNDSKGAHMTREKVAERFRQAANWMERDGDA